MMQEQRQTSNQQRNSHNNVNSFKVTNLNTRQNQLSLWYYYCLWILIMLFKDFARASEWLFGIDQIKNFVDF